MCVEWYALPCPKDFEILFCFCDLSVADGIYDAMFVHRPVVFLWHKVEGVTGKPSVWSLSFVMACVTGYGFLCSYRSRHGSGCESILASPGHPCAARTATNVAT